MELEYMPGKFITCRIIRELELYKGLVECLVYNHVSDELIYVYDTTR